MTAEPDNSNSGPDRRTTLIGGAVALVVLVAGVVVFGGGDDSGESTSGVPSECIEAWNGDPQAVAFAQHNAASHGYNQVQVGYLGAGDEPEVSLDADAGNCVAVFARAQADPDPLQAGQVYADGAWRPLSEDLPPATLAQLQTTALEDANATAQPTGELSSLEGS